MWLIILFSGIIVAAMAIVFLFIIPSHGCILVRSPFGNMIRISRRGILLGGKTYRYVGNAFEQIHLNAKRFVEMSNEPRSLRISTADRERVGLFMSNGHGIEVVFAIDSIRKHQKEMAIRAFFSQAGIQASRDQPARNGDGSDIMRVLAYPLEGSASDVTHLIQRIVVELCDILAEDTIDISFD